MAGREELTQRLGDLMSRWLEAVQRHDQMVATHEGLTLTERQCLALLVAGPLAPHQIAQGIPLSRAAVTSLLDRLERQGLVQRRADPADRRRLSVVATAEAEALLGRHYGALAQRGQALLAGLKADELGVIVGFLEKALQMQAEVTQDLAAQMTNSPRVP